MVVRLTGDGAEYISMLERAQEATSRFVEKVTRALEAIGIEKFLHSAVEAFSGREQGMIRLNAVLQTSGQNVQALTEDYNKFSAAIAHHTMASAGDVKQLLATAGTYGLYGERAQQATEDAIKFGEATGAGAEAALRVTQALEKGNVQLAMRMSRHMAPQLREAKTPEEFQAKFQELIAQGSIMAEEKSKSLEGQLHHLSTAWKSLKADLGAVVAEGLKPVIKGFELFVQWLKTASPEAKRTVVAIAAVGAGLLALGPAWSVLKVVLAPLGSLFGMLLSPGGLLVGGVAAATGAVLYFSGAGGKALEWLGTKWDELKTDAQKGIKGIGDAMKAGDMQLAFDIAWTQIQLTFHKATKEIQKFWIDFTTGLKVIWADVVAFLQRLWTEFVFGLQKSISVAQLAWAGVRRAFGGSAEQFERDLGAAAERLAEADKDRARHHDEIEADRQKAQADAFRRQNEQLDALENKLKDLEKKRDALVAKAADKALDAERKRQTAAAPIHVKADLKFDAVAFHSVEAMARVASFAALMAGGAPGEHAIAGEQLAVQKEMRDHLRNMDQGGGGFAPAEIG